MSNALATMKERLNDKDLKAALAKVLPRHISIERLCMVTLQAVTQQPLLLQCSPNSIIHSLLQAAQLGLEVGGGLGHGYLVPYKDKQGAYRAQFIPGYRGLMDLARRGGAVADIEARIVREGDSLTVEYGLSPSLLHTPASDADEVKGAYAIATFPSGAKKFDWMSKKEIDKIRTRSRAGQAGPWVTDYEEMCKKTVVRRLCKYLPLSPDLARALELENSAESGDVLVAEIAELQDPEPPIETTTEKIKKKLAIPDNPPDNPSPVIFTPAEEPAQPPRPTIDEVKEQVTAAMESEIVSLLDKLHYTDKQRAEMDVRYANKRDVLLKHLRKAVFAKEEREQTLN